jgi:diguanylate cyclase (GGDEF)-like protein
VDLSTPAPPRLRSDPHVFLALALAVPTIIVDVLDQGPNELGIAILAFAFLVVQVSLTAVGLALGLASTGYSSQRLSLRHLPSLDRWSLLRLLLAVAFVAVGAYATADADSAPLAPLYIPVIGVAAAIIRTGQPARVPDVLGTFNRRHFEPSLERMIAARRRLPIDERPPLAAILFDLDLFGAFNKFHGHQTGDAVLRAFGKLVRERFRASDLVARYGGEEFVAILDGTGRDEAFRIAEEIRTAFAEQSFRGASGERLSATVSAGCAELGPEDGLGELLGACDVGLAMAKGAGRNQVVAA